MLINYTNNNKSEVKFISYSGSYPCLCHGDLTLEINQKEYVLEGWKVLMSGGGLDEEYDPYTGEWEIDYQGLPDEIKQYAYEIDACVNENVPYGCCGGCS